MTVCGSTSLPRRAGYRRLAGSLWVQVDVDEASSLVVGIVLGIRSWFRVDLKPQINPASSTTHVITSRRKVGVRFYRGS